MPSPPPSPPPSPSPSPPSSPSPQPAPPRPLIETIGFAFWLVAAVLLMVGGMMAASAPTPGTPASRGVGILIAVAGVGMAFMAGRSRNGDARFRRAAIALSGAVVVIVALTAPLGVYIFTLIGVVLLIIGTILNALPRRDRD